MKKSVFVTGEAPVFSSDAAVVLPSLFSAFLLSVFAAVVDVFSEAEAAAVVVTAAFVGIGFSDLVSPVFPQPVIAASIPVIAIIIKVFFIIILLIKVILFSSITIVKYFRN